MAEEPEADLDSIVDRLLEVRGSRPGQQVQLEEYEIRFLCKKAREIFIQQPILLELEAPIKVSIPFYRKSCDCFYGFILYSFDFYCYPRNRFTNASFRYVVIYMANIMIYCDYSNMVDSLRNQIIFS